MISIPKIKCQGKDLSTRDGCENEARYINSVGEWLCSLCDMKRSFTSVRISSIPRMLQLVAGVFNHERDEWIGQLKEMLWRRNRI